jgi:hypothetical protein
MQLKDKIKALSKYIKDVKIDLESIEVELKPEAKFIDSGRKPNSTPPPISAILNWIKSKKLTSPQNELRLAFAISTSIGKKGIKPKPFINNLINQIINISEKEYEKMINELIEQSYEN